MLPYPTILAVAIVGVVMACIFVFIGTGSVMSVLVILTLAGILYYLLEQFGVISVSMANNQVSVKYRETATAPPAPSSKTKTTQSIEKKEVFYISGNDYT
jgi:hypothetical protein